jgi:hypothetical protein
MIPRAPDRYDRANEDAMRSEVDRLLAELDQRANVSHLSGDRGDASLTINAGDDLEVQRFATALTANRTVTLGRGFAGAKFTVVRTGLGAFTLDVGGLKTIPAGTAAFVDVGHDGSAWFLVRYGVL